MRKGIVPVAISGLAFLLFIAVFVIYPVAGGAPPNVAPASNLPFGSFGESSLEGSCEAPPYLAVTFPPSPVEPPLPPLNDKPYQEPNYVCFDFAREFCEDARDVEAIKQCFVLLFDSHAINMISFSDDTGKWWVCVVEPQTNEYYCMPAEEWTNLNQTDWIQKTLCQDYYKYSEEKCSKRSFIIPLCEGMEGSACSRDESGDLAMCFPETGKKVGSLKCTCRYIPYEVCSWEPFLQPAIPQSIK